jgi:hypothetical protein
VAAVIESLAERQALQWAIQFFRDRAGELKLKGSKRRLEEPEMTVLLLAAHYVYDYTPEERSKIYLELVDGARNRPERMQNLVQFAATLIERGEPLPKELRGPVAELLRNPPRLKSKPGPGRWDLAGRDILIFRAIFHVSETWKFELRRNQVPGRRIERRPCAASIVRDALEVGVGLALSEAAVNTILNKTIASMRAFMHELGETALHELVEFSAQLKEDIGSQLRDRAIE